MNKTNNIDQVRGKVDFEKIEIPVLSQLIILYEIIHKIIFSFPKYERYSLGEKIQSSVLSAIEFVIIANGSNKYEKERILQKANSKVELLKIFIRIAMNFNMIKTEKYLELTDKIQEIGKMIYGWIKYTRNIN